MTNTWLQAGFGLDKSGLTVTNHPKIIQFHGNMNSPDPPGALTKTQCRIRQLLKPKVIGEL
jgi:hypothetical protein